MKAPALLATLATVALLATGCGSTTTHQAGPAGHHATPGQSGQSGMAGMPGMSAADMKAGRAPSKTASMVCGAEIRGAVKRTFALSHAPSSTHTWSHRLFTCTYALPGGPLRLSVKDLTDRKAGRAHFDGLRSSLAGARRIAGMASLGFPSFETASGNVVFLKDGKTLRVDATRVSRSALPAHFSRQEAAYGVAAAVIACWTE